MASWHIITSEYPPQTGGVSDYTHLIAHGLANAGDEVHVWCPAASSAGEVETADATGVVVHRELGSFTSADLRRVGDLLDQFKSPRRLLVQWVPHGYGYRSMNLPFCLWLRSRAVAKHDVIELMVHEPFLAFGEGSWKQNGAAAVHRSMTVVLLKAAQKVWMSIPAWEKLLRPYALGRALPFRWLPVPSNIPVVDDPEKVRLIRERYTSANEQLVGHFGTYDRHIAGLLSPAVSLLLQASARCHMLLLGRGSEQMRVQLAARHPDLAARIHAAGALPAAELSLHITACDLLLQPYIDGVSSRRTSVMVGISHGVPIVTTSGRLTEPLWAESEAVTLAPVADIETLVRQTSALLSDKASRRRLSAAAKQLYDQRFTIEQTIAALRGHSKSDQA